MKKVKKNGKKTTTKPVGNTYHARIEKGECGRCGGENTSKYKTCSKCRRKLKRKRAGKRENGVQPAAKIGTVTIRSKSGVFAVPASGNVQIDIVLYVGA